MKPEAVTEREWLWQGLVAQGRAQGAVPAAEPEQAWYLGLMLGAAAWFAGLLLMLTTALVWNLSGSEAFLPLALFWGVPGLLLLRVQGLGVFPWQLGLALLIAGECAAVAAIGMAFEEAEPTLLASAILFAGVAAVAPRPAARVLNVVAACAAWALFLRWSLLGEPWRWYRQEEARPALAEALLIWLLCWGPMLAVVLWIARSEARWMATHWSPLLRAALIGLCVALAFATPLADPLAGVFIRESDGSRDWLALWPLLSLFAAGAAAAVAFQQRMRALLALCLAGMLLHVAHFYFALGVSLLAKSVWMLLMGAALLGLAYWLREDRQ